MNMKKENVNDDFKVKVMIDGKCVGKFSTKDPLFFEDDVKDELQKIENIDNEKKLNKKHEDQLEYFMHLLNPDPYAPFKSKVLNCDDNPNCVNSYASKIQNEDKVIFDGNITALNQSKIKLPNFEDYIKAEYNKSDGMEWI